MKSLAMKLKEIKIVFASKKKLFLRKKCYSSRIRSRIILLLKFMYLNVARSGMSAKEQGV